MRIDRCVCTGRYFESLLAQARAEEMSLEELMDETGAGRNCGSCGVYLCRGYRTGQVVFRELIDAAAEPPAGPDDRVPAAR